MSNVTGYLRRGATGGVFLLLMSAAAAKGQSAIECQRVKVADPQPFWISSAAFVESRERSIDQIYGGHYGFWRQSRQWKALFIPYLCCGRSRKDDLNPHVRFGEFLLQATAEVQHVAFGAAVH